MISAYSIPCDDMNSMSDKYISKALSHSLERFPFLNSMAFNLEGYKSHTEYLFPAHIGKVE